MASTHTAIKANRALVLTLWAAVVAERLGLDRDEALTLGRAVAGLNAHAKGVALGLFQPAPKQIQERRGRMKAGEILHVEPLRRSVPVAQTPEGLRALSRDRPIEPKSVERYLAGKFGDALDEVRAAMARLADSLPPAELAARAFELYERFRPAVPGGEAGWGATGVLDLGRIDALARR